MRQNRFWQNSLAHLRQFEGDEVLCDMWYPWAVTKLQFMLLNHPGSTSELFAPAPEVEICIDTRPNHIYIKAGDYLYLESGYYDLRRTEICTEDFYKQALLLYNTAMKPYILSDTTPIQGKLQLTADFPGEQLLDAMGQTGVIPVVDPVTGLAADLGFASQVIRAKDKPLAEVTDPCYHTYRNGGYFDVSDHAGMKKMCQDRIPSSMFTGKTRLFVQSLYGSKREDYECNWYSITDFNYRLKVQDYDLVAEMIENTWLLTTDTYDYFLIRYLEKTIEVTPLELNGKGAALKALMLADPEFTPISEKTRRLEAYILTTAKILKDKMVSFPVTGDQLVGKPQAYGWHTKWNGRTADVVTLTPEYDMGGYKNRHYRMAIVPTVDDKGVYTFKAIITLQEGPVDWWPIYGNVSFIYPQYLPGFQAGMYLTTCTAPELKYTATDYDAPVYVCYDKDDTAQVFRLNYHTVNPLGVDTWYEDVRSPTFSGDTKTYTTINGSSTPSAYYKVTRNGADVVSEKPVNATSTKKVTWDLYEFKFIKGAGNINGGFDYGINILGSPYDPYSYMITNGYWPGSMGGPVNISDGYYELYWFEWENWTISMTTEDHSQHVEWGAVFLEIPMHDCEQVWCGGTKNTPGHMRNKYAIDVSSGCPIHGKMYGEAYFTEQHYTASLGMIDEWEFEPWSQPYNTVTGTLIYDETEYLPGTGHTTVKEGMTSKVIYSNQMEADNGWHFFGSPETDDPFYLEFCRSNCTGEFNRIFSHYCYTNNDENKDFPADSSVGWA